MCFYNCIKIYVCKYTKIDKTIYKMFVVLFIYDKGDIYLIKMRNENI